MILARESVVRSGCFPGFFVFVIVFLPVTLFCTFRRDSLLSFYVLCESRLITTLFLALGWGCLSERVQAGIYLSRLLTLEDGTDSLSRKVGNELPLLAA
jgi:NADH:ubiquinone oxidoreductase subunit 4 (subunit M)